MKNFVENKTLGFFALIMCFVLLGYGFFSKDLLLLDDDIAGRFKAVNNANSFKAQITAIKNWTMGRPIGHLSNVTMQGIFLRFPESVISFFAIMAIALQSVFLKKILVKTGFTNFHAILMALVFLGTPITVSLFLPVHSFATELSTWFMLVAIFFALKNRPLVAGFFAALQFATYETYATVFWLPLAFLFLQWFLSPKSDESVGSPLRILFKPGVLFVLMFVLTVGLLIFTRLMMTTSGREAGIGELGVGGIISRMFQAGAIGFKANLEFQVEATAWSLKNGPEYIKFLLFVFPVMLLMLFTWLNPKLSTEPQKSNVVAMFLYLGLGLVLLYASFMIYFEQRFPPEVKVSRIANIHSGSRFGLIFIFAAIINLPIKSTRFQNSVASIILGLGLAFHHSYGFQQAQSSKKKAIVIDALRHACQHSKDGDIIALLLPAEISRYKSDIIIAWTSPYIIPTTFEHFDNKAFFVTYNRADEFETLMESKAGLLSKADVENISHMSFVKLKWLYPYGDASRWDIDGYRTLGVKVNYSKDKKYSYSFLGSGTPKFNAERKCSIW